MLNKFRPGIEDLDRRGISTKLAARFSRRAQGYAVAVGTGQPDQNGWIKAKLRMPSGPLQDLEMRRPSDEAGY